MSTARSKLTYHGMAASTSHENIGNQASNDKMKLYLKGDKYPDSSLIMTPLILKYPEPIRRTRSRRSLRYRTQPVTLSEIIETDEYSMTPPKETCIIGEKKNGAELTSAETELSGFEHITLLSQRNRCVTKKGQAPVKSYQKHNVCGDIESKENEKETQKHVGLAKSTLFADIKKLPPSTTEFSAEKEKNDDDKEKEDGSNWSASQQKQYHSKNRFQAFTALLAKTFERNSTPT